MLDRMHSSKTTSDELKAFYSGTKEIIYRIQMDQLTSIFH
jgi:hypothetical protein